MNLYKKIKKRLSIAFAISMRLSAQQPVHQVELLNEPFNQLDAMHDFAYPTSAIQLARQDLNQSVYFLQQQNFDQAVSLLQDAASRLMIKTNQELSDDDKEHIAAMIAQITAIINSHNTNEKRVVIEDLCSQISQSL